MGLDGAATKIMSDCVTGIMKGCVAVVEAGVSCVAGVVW